VLITAAIMASTAHAARVCDPKNRDRRPSLRGLSLTRMTVNVTIPASTPVANMSSTNPVAAPLPDPRDRERPREQGPRRPR